MLLLAVFITLMHNNYSWTFSINRKTFKQIKQLFQRINNFCVNQIFKIIIYSYFIFYEIKVYIFKLFINQIIIFTWFKSLTKLLFFITRINVYTF